MNSGNMVRRAGVMGWPVDHSKSPILHEYWLKHYGISGSYVHLPVKPNELASALESLAKDGFAGVNLTVPHKQKALDIVDEISDEARRIGAVNTIFVSSDGRLRATNTDAYGFISNLRAGVPNFDLAKGPAVILGAGGAARAVCVALQDAGVPELRIVNRTLSRAEALAKDLGGRFRTISWNDYGDHLTDATLLVNTTTLGMIGQPPLDIDLVKLNDGCVVTDVVYSPLETLLLRNARTRGLITVDGLGMLLYQAQAGFEGWFGRKPEVTSALREYILSVG